MTEAQIKHLVNRFLYWRLPTDFHPDAGIKFDANEPVRMNPQNRPHEPIGTNLFTATQATEMVKFMLEGMPSNDTTAPSCPVRALVDKSAKAGVPADAVSYADAANACSQALNNLKLLEHL